MELALYDVRLHDDTAGIVRAALLGAHERGVKIRLVYNVDRPDRFPVPPPPKTEPELIESLPFETAGIPGWPDLMHHKYVVRDGAAIWTGSTNWTDDSWTREENVIAILESAPVAARFGEDFEQLWKTREVDRSGKVDSSPVDVDGKPVRTWFSPKRGEKLAHQIARGIATAERRVRIASPVITSGPILGTLAEVAADWLLVGIWENDGANAMQLGAGLRESATVRLSRPCVQAHPRRMAGACSSTESLIAQTIPRIAEARASDPERAQSPSRC